MSWAFSLIRVSASNSSIMIQKICFTGNAASCPQEQKEVSDRTNSTYSPLSLCNQAIYPGDDKLLVMEKEILEVKYKILDDPFYRNGNNSGKVS